MKVIAGLGNPGRRYAGTRHNVGFDVVERLVERRPPEVEDESVALWRVTLPVLGPGGEARPEPVVIVAPLAFMNRSGPPLKEIVDANGADPATDLLVVVDDLDLEPGRLRMRKSGSSGGHRGLASIEEALGSRDYARLRVGVGKPPEGVPVEDWVLSRAVIEAEASALAQGIARAADAARAWLARGAERAMDEFNRAPAA